MAKSDKATVLRRVQDVLRLVLAGAEFADIRQYASDQDWQVSGRQVRRYMESAYGQLASAAKRDRDQLLGRHLMQRRALYARCLKGNDLRTALQVLRDEAALQGLYPPTKIAPTTPDGKPLTFDQRQVHINAILVERFGVAEVREIRSESDDTRHSSSGNGAVLGPGAAPLEPPATNGHGGTPDPEGSSPTAG